MRSLSLLLVALVPALVAEAMPADSTLVNARGHDRVQARHHHRLARTINKRKCKSTATASGASATATDASATAADATDTSTPDASVTDASAANATGTSNSTATAPSDPSATVQDATQTIANFQATAGGTTPAATTGASTASASASASASAAGGASSTGDTGSGGDNTVQNSSTDPEGNGPFNGVATWFDVGTNACGFSDQSDMPIVAVSKALFEAWPGYNGNSNDNPVCGKHLEITWGGKTLVVEVTDECPECDKRSLDLSKAAFQHFADLGTGTLDMTWSWVDGFNRLPTLPVS